MDASLQPHILDAIMEGTDCPIAVVDRSMRIIGVSALSTMERGEAMGRTFPDLARPDDRPALIAAITQVLTCGTPASYEASTATEQRYQSRVLPLIVDGVTQGAIILGRNVTAEHRLDQMQGLFREVIEQISLAAVLIDSDRRILFANKALCSIVGVPAASLTGMTYDAPSEVRIPGVLSPRQEFEELLAGVRSHSVYEDRLPTPHGEPLHMRWHTVSLPQADGGRIIASLGEDLSETERLAATLEEVERVAHVGHWVWDIATEALSWSAEVYSIFGVTPDFHPTYPGFLERVHPDDRQAVTASVANALGGPGSYEVTHRVLRADGVRWVNERAELRRLADGRPAQMFGTVQDVTDRVVADQALRTGEERLRQSQKMEALGLLAGGIAHDFNNLLSVILGFSSLLTGEALEPSVLGPIEQIRNAAERGKEFTQQLLAFSRQQVLHPVPTNLAQIAREFIGLSRGLLGSRVTWVVRIEAEPWILVDPGQIGRIVMNLCINARDAMPNGGRITCTVDVVVVDGLHPCADHVPHGTWARLVVADDGIGIDPAIRSRIFEPFVTTKPRGRGSGLGLSTVYGIVQQSCGHLCVDSEPGQGATFTAFFPLHAGAVPVAAPERASAQIASGAVIVVVEDDDDVRHVTTQILRQRGIAVIAFPCGADALAFVQQDKPIDLLLVDMVMPGMTGLEFVRQARILRPGIPALLMTGFADIAASRHEFVDETIKVVSKPLTAAELGTAVAEALLEGRTDGHRHG